MVSFAAPEVVASTVGSHDRVLVTGASGWFGRTALELIPRGIPILAIASGPKRIDVGGRPIDCVGWDDAVVAEFAPTVVIDCAFLTRDLVGASSLDEYVGINRELTARAVRAVETGGVRLLVTVSSGAAVYPSDALVGDLEDNPYGYLKREAEEQLRAVAGEQSRVVVARAWSVSGTNVQKPRSYALTDLMIQALGGEIVIGAPKLVYRRYVGVDDLLAASLALPGGAFEVVDSGGELVELAELADRIGAVVAPGATIRRASEITAQPDRYYSDNTSWSAAVEVSGLAPADLDRQLARIHDSGIVNRWAERPIR